MPWLGLFGLCAGLQSTSNGRVGPQPSCQTEGGCCYRHLHPSPPGLGLREINCREGSAQTRLDGFSFPRAPFRSCRRSARLCLHGEVALIHFLHDPCSLACSRSTPPGRGAQELVASISQAREVSPWSKITAAKKLPLQIREFVYFCCLLSSN